MTEWNLFRAGRFQGFFLIPNVIVPIETVYDGTLIPFYLFRSVPLPLASCYYRDSRWNTLLPSRGSQYNRSSEVLGMRHIWRTRLVFCSQQESVWINFFWSKYYWLGPFCLGRFNDFLRQHFSHFWLFKLLGFSPSWSGAEWVGWRFSGKSYMRCLALFTCTRCPFHIDWIFVSISKIYFSSPHIRSIAENCLSNWACAFHRCFAFLPYDVTSAFVQ